jgi:hypothetical protein
MKTQAHRQAELKLLRTRARVAELLEARPSARQSGDFRDDDEPRIVLRLFAVITITVSLAAPLALAAVPAQASTTRWTRPCSVWITRGVTSYSVFHAVNVRAYKSNLSLRAAGTVVRDATRANCSQFLSELDGWAGYSFPDGPRIPGTV